MNNKRNMECDVRERYSRQLLLPEIGEEGQSKLARATVFIAGAGGLGSSVALYLAAAGIGRLIICDHDTVQVSNLNRQILHGSSAIHAKKVDSAYARVHDLNPTIQITTYDELITSASIATVAHDAVVIVDCLDNYESRLVLNTYSIQKKVPYILGSINGFEGHLSFLSPPSTPCLYCIFQGTSFSGAIPVMGATAGVIGSLQAMEVIKYVANVGKVLANTLLAFDGTQASFRTVSIQKNPGCPHCSHLS